MGMRATIGVIDSNLMKLTSVQWSTVLDRTLGVTAHNALSAHDGDKDKALQDLLEILTQITDDYEHISAFEVVAKDQREDTDAYMGHGSIVARGVERGSGKQNRFSGMVAMKKTSDLRERAFNYHLDGGSVGVLLNKSEYDKTGKVDLFYLKTFEGTLL